MSMQQRMYEELTKTINLTGSQRFLLATTPKEWDWPVNATYMEQAEYQMIGYMPEAVPDNKPYFIRTSKSVYDAYSTVIQSVKIVPSDDQTQAVADIDDLIAKAQATYDINEATLNDQRKDVPEEEFLKTGRGKRLKRALDASDKELDKLFAQRDEITDEWDPQRKEALDALVMKEGKPGYTKIRVGASIEVFPKFLVDMNGQDWARKVRKEKAGQSKEIVISSSSTSHKESEDQIGVEGGVKVFFMKIFDAEGKAKEINLEDKNASTTITMSFKALTTVSVNPHDGWYKSGYLTKIAQDDEWKRSAQTTETMFGKEGILHSLICGFIAAYQPSLKIETTGENFKKVQEALEGSAGVTIPPFSFGSYFGVSGDASASGKHSEIKWDKRKEGNAIIIESPAEVAQIIGVLVDQPVKV